MNSFAEGDLLYPDPQSPGLLIPSTSQREVRPKGQPWPRTPAAQELRNPGKPCSPWSRWELLLLPSTDNQGPKERHSYTGSQLLDQPDGVPTPFPWALGSGPYSFCWLSCRAGGWLKLQPNAHALELFPWRTPPPNQLMCPGPLSFLQTPPHSA